MTLEVFVILLGCWLIYCGGGTFFFHCRHRFDTLYYPKSKTMVSGVSTVIFGIFIIAWAIVKIGIWLAGR